MEPSQLAPIRDRPLDRARAHSFHNTQHAHTQCCYTPQRTCPDVLHCRHWRGTCTAPRQEHAPASLPARCTTLPAAGGASTARITPGDVLCAATGGVVDQPPPTRRGTTAATGATAIGSGGVDVDDLGNSSAGVGCGCGHGCGTYDRSLTVSKE